MRKIDIKQWNRKEVFQFFSEVSDPFYVVCFRQDVTKLVQWTRQNGLSFYYSLIWLCTKALNRIDAFQYLIEDGEVYHIERRYPSFTDLKPNSEVFHITTCKSDGDIAEFCSTAKEKSLEQNCFIQLEDEGTDLIYFSCLPWIDITAVTNEKDRNDPNSKDDAIPHITWGRYIEKDGRLELGISLEVNHRFIDGYHIGRFTQELTNCINELIDE